MTNAKRLQRIRKIMEDKKKDSLGSPGWPEMTVELLIISADELCKTNEILQRKFNIYHIGGD